MSFLTNKTAFKTFEKDVAAAGAAEQLPNVQVPDHCVLVIKAKDTNTGNIEVGESEAVAEGALAFILAPGQAIELAITNASLVWIDATVSGEGVHGIVEQN